MNCYYEIKVAIKSMLEEDGLDLYWSNIMNIVKSNLDDGTAQDFMNKFIKGAMLPQSLSKC